MGLVRTRSATNTTGKSPLRTLKKKLPEATRKRFGTSAYFCARNPQKLYHLKKMSTLEKPFFFKNSMFSSTCRG